MRCSSHVPNLMQELLQCIFDITALLVGLKLSGVTRSDQSLHRSRARTLFVYLLICFSSREAELHERTALVVINF